MPNRKIHNIPPLSIQFVIQIPAPAVLPGYRFVIQIFNAAVNPEENLYYKSGNRSHMVLITATVMRKIITATIILKIT